jgi:hypothetical protein
MRDSIKGLSIFALTVTGCEMAQPQRTQRSENVYETDALQEHTTETTPTPQPQRIETPPAEQTGFTEREQREIENIKRELMNQNNPSRVNTYNVQRMRLVEEAVRQIDPTLIGRNVIFAPRWLEVMGDGKPMPRASFQQWRDRTDIVYDAYADLVGQGPGPQGERHKTLIDLHPRASFRSAELAGVANTNLVIINKDHTSFSRCSIPGIVYHNSWDMTLMHELAHCFTNGGQSFTYDSEAICDLLTCYVLENVAGARMGSPEGRGDNEKVIGNQLRRQLLDRIRIRFREDQNRIPAFSGGTTRLSASNYFALSPIDAVGWEPYKQVFRSYNDEGYNHEFTYRGGSSGVRRAREFFDRLAHFSGKPDLMASSAMGRQLFDRHFGAGANVVATARTTAPATATRNTGVQQMSTTPRDTATATQGHL